MWRLLDSPCSIAVIAIYVTMMVGTFVSNARLSNRQTEEIAKRDLRDLEHKDDFINEQADNRSAVFLAVDSPFLLRNESNWLMR